MRTVFTLLLAIVFNHLTAQNRVAPDTIVNCTPPNSNSTKIVIRCRATNPATQPLYIIDGIVADSLAMRKLNPNDIERIDILKDAQATAIYGSAAVHGVIIITTKTITPIIVLRDLETDEPVQHATVLFANEKEEKFVVSGENGKVDLKGLKPSNSYSLKVSSVGFKDTVLNCTGSMVSTNTIIKLERQARVLEPVVVSTIRCYRTCRRIWSTCKVTGLCAIHLTGGVSINDKLLFYPNPVSRGQQIRIDAGSNFKTVRTISLFNFSGTQVWSRMVDQFEDVNKISIPVNGAWSAGMYLVKLSDAKGKSLKEDKILVQ